MFHKPSCEKNVVLKTVASLERFGSKKLVPHPNFKKNYNIIILSQFCSFIIVIYLSSNWNFPAKSTELRRKVFDVKVQAVFNQVDSNNIFN